MKKITVLALLFTIGISYSQTKKKENKSKKVVPTETIQEEKISIVEINPNSDGETVGNPYGNAPVFDEKEDDNTIYNSAGIEVQPEFPGGNKVLFTFISKNFKYTDEMKENELKGRVVASFVVEKDGSITDIKVVRGIGYETDYEVLRVLKSMPKWIPGEQNGRKVRCSYVIPIMIYATK
jgi:protein TonB